MCRNTGASPGTAGLPGALDVPGAYPGAGSSGPTVAPRGRAILGVVDDVVPEPVVVADREGAEGDDAWEDEARWRGGGPRRWWGWTALALSVVGFGDSLYLTVDHFTQGTPFCPATGFENCAKVTTSAQAEIFGVLPVALVGLLFFTVMVAVDVPALWRRGGLLGQRLAYGRLALVTAGIGMVAYLVYSELVTIGAICLYCTGVHVVTLLLFVLVVATFPVMASAAGEEPG